MGFEYQLRFQPPDAAAWQALVDRLPPPADASRPSFTVNRTDDGCYFCDHDRSAASAVALRRLIDEAIVRGAAVTIEEI